MTEKNSSDQTQTREQASSDNSEAQGIRAGLTEAQRAMLASKSRGGDSGLQSVGKNHKPTHASGKQGPVEKKVRW
ncbi:hypothetical protein GCM10009712_22690 [Pseudarthrobacter sulfonivorans]|uniref:hypothetical protein n=1 Tax=Pseudarthrobacter sulfonivorans TaxID=121292 RepID=UPI00168C0C5C|nr:hypothetical protein [Pseudarthrobacter sulfonivorans]